MVLTVDPDHEAWRHVIDADGIETSRQPANETAAAALYREQIGPPDETPVAIDVPVSAPGDDAPAGSLLAKVLAWSRVMELLGEANGSVEQLRALIEPFTVLNASFSVGSLRRMAARAEAGGGARSLDDLMARLRDELAQTTVVTVPSSGFAADGDPPFGPLVDIHFPAAAYDIEEAAHCLALRRSTAAVLHAMRVMRHGLLTLQHLLATPPLTDLNWARLITAVRGVAGDQHDLIEALVRVRRAWRAPELPPADKYTEEEAEAVLSSVGAFMRLVAGRLDEVGLS